MYTFNFVFKLFMLHMTVILVHDNYNKNKWLIEIENTIKDIKIQQNEIIKKLNLNSITKIR